MNTQNEQERDRQWLGELTSLDLTDLSFGAFDLSRGSTKEWWEQVKEIPLNLHGASIEELEAELKRRKKVAELKSKPLALNGIFPKELRETCEAYLDEAWNNDYVDEDLPHYIFEAAMEAIFGEGIFEKIRIHRQRRNK